MPSASTHRVLLAAMLALGSVQANAVAAPKPKPVKPVCNLIQDPAGDTDPTRGSAALDILTADIVADAISLTWAIRTAAAQPDSELQSAAGRHWQFSYAVANKVLSHEVSIGPLGLDTPGQPSAKTAVDASGKELRFTLPLADLKLQGADIRPGMVVKDMKAFTDAGVQGPGGRFFRFGVGDNADLSTSTYTVGRRSCLKPVT